MAPAFSYLVAVKIPVAVITAVAFAAFTAGIAKGELGSIGPGIVMSGADEYPTPPEVIVRGARTPSAINEVVIAPVPVLLTIVTVGGVVSIFTNIF